MSGSRPHQTIAVQRVYRVLQQYRWSPAFCAFLARPTSSLSNSNKPLTSQQLIISSILTHRATNSGNRASSTTI
jgi:hypothetical protein